jgi:hypothetical protein
MLEYLPSKVPKFVVLPVSKIAGSEVVGAGIAAKAKPVAGASFQESSEFAVVMSGGEDWPSRELMFVSRDIDLCLSSSFKLQIIYS